MTSENYRDILNISCSQNDNVKSFTYEEFVKEYDEKQFNRRKYKNQKNHKCKKQKPIISQFVSENIENITELFYNLKNDFKDKGFMNKGSFEDFVNVIKDSIDVEKIIYEEEEDFYEDDENP